MTVFGGRRALAALSAAGLVVLVVVANNMTGGPVPVAGAVPSNGSLSGSVTEAGTQATGACDYAAAKAAPHAYVATTDVNGNYDFANMAAGQYDVFFGVF